MAVVGMVVVMVISLVVSGGEGAVDDGGGGGDGSRDDDSDGVDEGIGDAVAGDDGGNVMVLVVVMVEGEMWRSNCSRGRYLEHSLEILIFACQAGKHCPELWGTEPGPSLCCHLLQNDYSWNRNWTPAIHFL